MTEATFLVNNLAATLKRAKRLIRDSDILTIAQMGFTESSNEIQDLINGGTTTTEFMEAINNLPQPTPISYLK